MDKNQQGPPLAPRGGVSLAVGVIVAVITMSLDDGSPPNVLAPLVYGGLAAGACYLLLFHRAR